jgi:ribosomal protein L37AE/L43A
MTFRKDEIRVEADEVEADEGVVYACPACAHPEFFHPEMVAPDDASIWCAECGHDFGKWPDFRAKLFTAGDMLAETLAKPPT